MRLNKWGLSLVLVCAGALAQDAVVVSGVRDPVAKSYRKMVHGMDVFEKRRALAPEATLRFKLLPRKRDTRMENIVLEVEGNSFSTPVAVAPDRTFTLARDAKALAEDAAVVPNRRAQTMTWRAEIRSPGVPPGTRRLGDLRLECEVGMAAELISNRTTADRMMDRIFGLERFCERRLSSYLFFAERPLFAVTLVSGERRETLRAGWLYSAAAEVDDIRKQLPWCDCEVLLDRTYYLPLADRSWPDDTRVEFEYMDDGIKAGGGTKAQVQAANGQAKVVRFDSGYEVWVYEDKKQLEEKKPSVLVAERVFLFDPSGNVAKTRTLKL
jgi:hypothetical protein